MKLLCAILFICIISTFSFAQWERTNGPEGISINSLANIDNVLYAGTRTDGVYASTDEGNSWFALNNGIETEEITAITSINDTLLIGTYSNGVYHSIDGGQTWLPSSNYNSNITVLAMIVKDQYVFASTSQGLLRSSNGGVTWEDISFLPFYESVSEMCITGNKLIATDFTDLYASTDNGDTWNEIQAQLTSGIFSLYAKDDTVFAGSRNKVYRSVDGGNTFFEIDIPFDYSLVNVNSIISIGNTLFMGTTYDDGIYKSTDNGLTWESANERIGPKDVRALAVTQSSYLIAGTHYAGVYRSIDNGENWNKSMTGFPAGSSILTLINSDAGIFAGTRDGVYKTTDNGITWDKLPAENDTVNYAEVRGICITNKEIYVALTYKFHGIIYKSTDSGETWKRCGNGFSPDIAFMTSVIISGNNIIAASDQGVYYSTDNGESWQLSNINQGFVVEMAATSGYVYATFNYGGVYRSVNDGMTWNPSYTPPSTFFNDMTALENYAYAGISQNGAYYTTDYGNNWYPAGFPTGSSVYAIKFIPAVSGMVLAGTDIEPNYIYASFGHSHNFSPYSEGLGVNAITEALTSNDLYAFAGTDYNGVWKRTLPGVTGVHNNDPELPDNFSLKQNYPNPFNPETTIEYSVPEGGIVTLKVYNVLGQEVQTLVNRFANPGTYTINFDASDLSSGVYYYRMEAGSFKEVHKMVLMR